MSACQHTRDAALDALTQGKELPTKLHAHVEECVSCRAELEEMERLWNRLKSWPSPHHHRHRPTESPRPCGTRPKPTNRREQ